MYVMRIDRPAVCVAFGASLSLLLAACLNRPGTLRLSRGATLYAQHCSVCHGPDGGGDGQGSPILFPPARNFASGRFRLVSTDNGVPSDDDFMRVLRRGMPGSAMPSFAWMEDEDLHHLASHVRVLATEGIATRLQGASAAFGTTRGAIEARRDARERMTPGEVFAPIVSVQSAPAVLARGRELYAEDCAACHGADGSGQDERPTHSEDGSVRWARDFTAGILKGGAGAQELTWRVQAGMPGSAMPAFAYEPSDTAALVAYVRSLIAEGMEERFVLNRSTVRAGRVPEIPRDPGATEWFRADETRVVLAPTWWRDDSIFECMVSALHDGEHVALRMRWVDPTRDVSQNPDKLGDGAALQLSSAFGPPLFGMGSREHPTNLWHWRAKDWRGEPGVLDLIESGRHSSPPSGAVSDAPLYVPSARPQRDSAESIEGRGPDVVGERSEHVFSVDVSSAWRDGVWEAVFVRSLRPRVTRELELSPGQSIQVACAIWNGSAENHGGRKSISIWQRLELEP